MGRHGGGAWDPEMMFPQAGIEDQRIEAIDWLIITFTIGGGGKAIGRKFNGCTIENTEPAPIPSELVACFR